MNELADWEKHIGASVSFLKPLFPVKYCEGKIKGVVESRFEVLKFVLVEDRNSKVWSISLITALFNIKLV